MVKVTIDLTKAELKHLLAHQYFTDNCADIARILEKLQKVAKKHG